MSELFEEYQEFRKILCACPCCGKIVRVSDLRLKAKGLSVRTWLDDHEKKERKLLDAEQNLDEAEERLREIAHDRGRKEAARIFRRAICPTLKALKLDPFDVKPLLNPVDFVVFNGMNKTKIVSDIILLSREYDCTPLNMVREQVKTAVRNKRYDFQLARVNEKGRIQFE